MSQLSLTLSASTTLGYINKLVQDWKLFPNVLFSIGKMPFGIFIWFSYESLKNSKILRHQIIRRKQEVLGMQKMTLCDNKKREYHDHTNLRG